MRIRRRIHAPLLFGGALIVVLGGCTMQRLVVRSTAVLIEDGFAALNEETDLELAAAGAGASLKLLDGMLRGSPDDPELLLLAAQGYIGYALAFVDPAERDRRVELNRRGRDYALAAWREQARRWRQPQPTVELLLDADALQAYLRALERPLVPAVYWTAAGWAAMIDAARGDPELLADIPVVSALARYVVGEQADYFYAGAHLLLGSIHGSVPAFLGGDPPRARAHFETAIAMTDGRFLMAAVLYASTYAVQTQDRALFDRLLTDVLGADPHLLPAQNLANAVARRRAAALRAMADELFA